MRNWLHWSVYTNILQKDVFSHYCKQRDYHYPLGIHRMITAILTIWSNWSKRYRSDCCIKPTVIFFKHFVAARWMRWTSVKSFTTVFYLFMVCEGAVIEHSVHTYVACWIVSLGYLAACVEESICERAGWQKLCGAPLPACMEESPCSAITSPSLCLSFFLSKKKNSRKEKSFWEESMAMTEAPSQSGPFTAPSLQGNLLLTLALP